MRALPLLILTLLAGPALAQRTGAAVACKEDNTDCQEDCSIEYGSSSRAYSQLSACLAKCKQKFDLCKDRHFALQEREILRIEDNPAVAAPPPPDEPTRTRTYDDSADSLRDDEDAPRRPSKPAAPVSRSAPEKAPAPTPAPPSDSPSTEPTTRRGVYRASEPEEAPAKPAPKSTPVAASEPDAPEEAEPRDAEPKESGTKPAATATAAAEPDPLAEDEDPPSPPPPPKPKSFERPEIPPEPKKKDISEWDPDGD